MAHKALVILNEQHSLMPDQQHILDETFDSFEIVSVPANGWTLEEIEQKSNEIVERVHEGFFNREQVYVVFASPIPIMIKFVCIMIDYMDVDDTVLVFHNDHREKKELPGGKIINVVAKEGWVLA